MIAYRLLISLAVLLMFCVGQAHAMLGVAPPSGQPLQLIVQYNSIADAAVSAPGSYALDRIKPGKRILTFPSQAALQQEMVKLKADPRVVYVEPDQRVTATFIPNDPLYPQQWDKMIQHAPDAWDKETGQSNVILFIVDTAFDCTTLPDLAANCRQDLSRDFISDPVYYFHGYHVAGIAAAVINNGLDIAGTAGTGKIAFGRFLDHTGAGSGADALKAWNYALSIASQGYRVVINNSWGGKGAPTQSFIDAAAALKAAGIVVTAAAGNSSTDNCTTPFWPAALTDVIAVASTDENDALSSFSNYGACSEDQGGVFIAAPGSDIVSLDNTTSSGVSTHSGTSMADPQVSGAITLILSQDPTLAIQDVKDRLAAGSINKNLPVYTQARLDLPGVLVPPPPGIKVSVTCPSPAEVNQDSTLSCTTSVRGVGGFTGTATLDCSGVQAAACLITPTTVAVGQTASVALTPSQATPAPQDYLLTIHATAAGVPDDTAQAQVKVWPIGTTHYQYVSTESKPLGGKKACLRCPVPNQVAATTIHVPDDAKILQMSGVLHISGLSGRQVTASLIPPAGASSSYAIPLASYAGFGFDAVFQTDKFDGTSLLGDWTMHVALASAQTVFSGALNGWELDVIAVPSTSSSTSVDFPDFSIDWKSQNASNCTASGAWSGSQPASGTKQFIKPLDGTYTLTCGSAQRSITVGVH